MAVNAAAASVAGIAGRDPNSYLPPPPIPQGLLGDSLFNQGSMAQFHPAQALLDHPGAVGPPAPPVLRPYHNYNSHRRYQQQQRPYNYRRRSQLPPGRDRSLEQPRPLMEIPVEKDENRSSLMENSQDMEPKVVSSGRNSTMDVVALLKQQRSLSSDAASSSPDNSNKATGNLANSSSSPQNQVEGEPKVLASGRNTINVAALMRSRQGSTETPQEKSEKKTNLATPPPGSSENLHPVPINSGPCLYRHQSRACNVPDWLVNDGGELKLSSTSNGDSILRFWPRYMNDHGHKTLFQSLRKSVKWFQRRYLPPNEEKLVSLPKLVSWVGPCDYEKDGMQLPTNTSWPPEIVDLLHRLIHFTNSSFNSCFLSLYTNGYAHHPWNTEKHEALEPNPTIATISLGLFLCIFYVLQHFQYCNFRVSINLEIRENEFTQGYQGKL